MTESLHICYLTDGHSIHSKRIADHFHNQGHQVTVVTHKSYFSSLDYPIEEVHLSKHLSQLPYGWIWSCAPQIWLRIKELKPDIVHGLYLSNIALYMLTLREPKRIATAIGSDVLLSGERDRVIRELMRRAMIDSSAVTVVSKSIQDAVLGFGVPLEKTHLIYFGVEKEFLIHGSRDNRSKIRVVSTRNFEPIYDVDTLIKSMPFILSDERDLEFLLVGKGTNAQRYQKLVNEFGVQENVTFAGFVPRDKMPKVLSESDVYVSTSLSDGMSVSTLEAMASGCIPILSNIPGNRELVEHGLNGFLFKKGDPRDLAATLKHCVDNLDDIRPGIVEENAKRIRKAYLWRDNMREMERLYKSIVCK